jgi:hypothetical protein
MDDEESTAFCEQKEAKKLVVSQFENPKNETS